MSPTYNYPALQDESRYGPHTPEVVLRTPQLIHQQHPAAGLPQHGQHGVMVPYHPPAQPAHQGTLAHYRHHSAPGVHHHHQVIHHANVSRDPISPYPELKDLTGPLKHAKHRVPGQDAPVQHQDAHSYGYHPRKEIGLPDFPFGQWKEDPMEHGYRPSYEQLLYADYEKRLHSGLPLEPQTEDERLGLQRHASDFEAVEIARQQGKLDSVAGHQRSPQHLANSIRDLLTKLRAEAERSANLARQYHMERGEHDEYFLQAHEAALQAEARASGAAAVMHAVENVPPENAQSIITSTVDAYRHENDAKQQELAHAMGTFGETDERTAMTRQAAMHAHFALEGAHAAEDAPRLQAIQATEDPRDVHMRESQAGAAASAKPQMKKMEADQAARVYGENDPRTVALRREAAIAAAMENDSRRASSTQTLLGIHGPGSAQTVHDLHGPPSTRDSAQTVHGLHGPASTQTVYGSAAQSQLPPTAVQAQQPPTKGKSTERKGIGKLAVKILSATLPSKATAGFFFNSQPFVTAQIQSGGKPVSKPKRTRTAKDREHPDWQKEKGLDCTVYGVDDVLVLEVKAESPVISNHFIGKVEIQVRPLADQTRINQTIQHKQELAECDNDGELANLEFQVGFYTENS